MKKGCSLNGTNMRGDTFLEKGGEALIQVKSCQDKKGPSNFVFLRWEGFRMQFPDGATVWTVELGNIETKKIKQ